MPDPTVTRWRQRGRVYLWRYRDNVRNFPGWHLSADETGCASLLELLTLMQKAVYPSRNTVRLSEPTPGVLAVPNNQGGEARWQSAPLLELHYRKERVEPGWWELKVQDDRVHLSIGAANLDKLMAGVGDIQAGQGDYAVSSEHSDDNSMLWFW